MSVQLHILKHQGYNINGQFKYAQAEINPIISVLADDDITYSDDGLECSNILIVNRDCFSSNLNKVLKGLECNNQCEFESLIQRALRRYPNSITSREQILKSLKELLDEIKHQDDVNIIFVWY